MFFNAIYWGNGDDYFYLSIVPWKKMIIDQGVVNKQIGELQPGSSLVGREKGEPFGSGEKWFAVAYAEQKTQLSEAPKPAAGFGKMVTSLMGQVSSGKKFYFVPLYSSEGCVQAPSKEDPIG